MADIFNVTVTGQSWTPTLVRNPSTPRETVIIQNTGVGTCILGTFLSMTPSQGIPFPPGSRVEIRNCSGPIYSCIPNSTTVAATLVVEAGTVTT